MPMISCKSTKNVWNGKMFWKRIIENRAIYYKMLKSGKKEREFARAGVTLLFSFQFTHVSYPEKH